MIGAIENAILARLKAAADAGKLGYTWGSLETYPVNWDAYLAEKGGQIVAPAAWVVFGGWGNSEIRGNNPRFPASFGIVVMAENARNEQATRHGAATGTGSEVGSYQLIMDAAALMSHETLGLDIDPIKVGSGQHVRPVAALADRKVSMMSLELRTAFVINDTLAYDPDAGDFARLHVNWDVPRLSGIDAAPGTPGIQIPDDVHADASDTVELEVAP